MKAARFTQSDLKRAYAGVTSAGMKVGRLEIDPNGKIVIHAATTALASSSGDSWADVK